MEQGGKREAVMQAALELVAEHGFHGAPMAEVAKRAGVAAGTIYCFFESKDALIKEVHAALERQVLAAVRAGYPEGRPVRERFLHVGRALIGFFTSSPLQYRFLEQYHFSPYGIAARRDRVFGRKDRNLICKLFEEARELRAVKDLPLPILYALTFGPLVDVCRDHILGFTSLDDALIERTVEACWDAIRQEPVKPPGGERSRP